MKKSFLILLVVLFCSSAFCEKWNIYSGADKETLETIKKCDDFIASKKYQSASYAVGGCSNEYIIYKYIEVCTQYFAQSMMHELFAFKNLEEGETLYSVRTGDGTFSLTYRETPGNVLDNYEAEHGKSIVLELARANYYYDAILRYGENWLKTPDEVMPFILDVYERAYENEVYDEQVILNYVNIEFGSRNWPLAEELYNLLAEKNPENGNYWYNLTVTKMWQEKYKDAIHSASMAVEHPEENPDYHLDAYTILADAYSYSGDYKNAEKTLLAAHEKYNYQPIVFQRLAELFLGFKGNENYAKADDYLDKVLTVVCDDNTIFNCIKVYLNYKTPEDALDFCTRNIKAFSDKNKKGLLSFYEAQMYAYMNQLEKMEKSLQSAEKLFKQANNEEWLGYCGEFRSQVTGQ